MECLVVLLVTLAICSAHLVFVPESWEFFCPAPNKKGLQAVCEEYSKFSAVPSNVIGKSATMNRLVHVLDKNDITNSPEFEKLEQFLCDKVYIYAGLYTEALNVAVMLSAQHDIVVHPPDSELREDFLNHMNYFHQSYEYRRSQEILYRHIRSDPYAQLGMEYLYSAEMKQILKEILDIPVLKAEVDKLTSLGVPIHDAIEVFVYVAVSSWGRRDKK